MSAHQHANVFVSDNVCTAGVETALFLITGIVEERRTQLSRHTHSRIIKGRHHWLRTDPVHLSIQREEWMMVVIRGNREGREAMQGGWQWVKLACGWLGFSDENRQVSG